MVSAKLTDGYLFDIQGFSVHDGPLIQNINIPERMFLTMQLVFQP